LAAVVMCGAASRGWEPCTKVVKVSPGMPETVGGSDGVREVALDGFADGEVEVVWRGVGAGGLANESM
jgi:hypothetical protein